MTVIRRLLRKPAAPILAVITLALGLGISTALFTITRDVVLKPFPFRDQERVVALWASIPERSVPHLELTLAQYGYFREQARTLEDVSVMSAANFSVIVNTPEPVNVKSNFVTRSFYPLLGVKALHGRVFTQAEHEPTATPVALISHRLWTSLFGSDPNIVGKPIDLEGDKATVVGVLPPELNLPVGADLILPLEPLYNVPEEHRHNSVLEGLARLEPGVTREQAQAELDVLANRIEKKWPAQYKGTENHLVPLVDEILGTTRPAMTTLFIMALLVLAIATLNAAGIFIARAVARQRDIAIRVALGATRGALLREVLAETLAVSLAAAAIGFALAKLAVALFVRIGPDSIPRLQHVSVSPATYAFAAGAAILIAVVCALFASTRGGGIDVRETIDRAAAAMRSRRALTTVAGVQLGVALVLLVGAALMIRSFLSIADIDAGFSREHVVTAHLPLPSEAYADPAKRKRFFEQVVEKLRSAPGVEKAGAVLIRPLELELGWDWTHTVEGQGAAEQTANPMANLVSATPGYMEAMGIPLLRGRYFTDGDKQDAPMAMIVGRSFATRYFGSVDAAVGKRVKAGKIDSKQPWRTIVGVVGDVRYRGLTTEKIDVYHPVMQSTWTPQYVALRTTQSPRVAEATLRAIVKSIDPTVPVSDVRSNEEMVDAKLAAPRLNAWILATFAGVALLLSIVGVYAVLSYAVRNRTTEMGVRLALGAKAGDLLRMVIRDALAVSIAATVAGTLAAVFLTQFLGSFLYGVSRAEPLTLLLAATIVIVAAIAGSVVPAIHAARTDPMVALRSE